MFKATNHPKPIRGDRGPFDLQTQASRCPSRARMTGPLKNQGLKGCCSSDKRWTGSVETPQYFEIVVCSWSLPSKRTPSSNISNHQTCLPALPDGFAFLLALWSDTRLDGFFAPLCRHTFSFSSYTCMMQYRCIEMQEHVFFGLRAGKGTSEIMQLVVFCPFQV